MLPEGVSTFFRVSREETTLVQEGIVNSSLPPHASSFLLPGDKDPQAQKGEGWDEVQPIFIKCSMTLSVLWCSGGRHHESMYGGAGSEHAIGMFNPNSRPTSQWKAFFSSLFINKTWYSLSYGTYPMLRRLHEVPHRIFLCLHRSTSST